MPRAVDWCVVIMNNFGFDMITKLVLVEREIVEIL